MALTPEMVLNKHFQTTQFRKGYDERDVDDFLDEIVAEMRSLIAQRDDYKQQLNDCRAGRGIAPVDVTPQDTVDPALVAAAGEAESRLAEARAHLEQTEAEHGRLNEQLTGARAELEELEGRIEASRAAVEQGLANPEMQSQLDAALQRAEDAENRYSALQTQATKFQEIGAAARLQVQSAEARAREAEEKAREAQQRADEAERRAQEGAPAAAAAPAGGGAAGLFGGGGAAGLIELAQRLHDEHVAEGENRRRSLINEGEARHAELLSTAQSKYDELLQTGQSRHNELLQTGQARHNELVTTAQARHDELIGTAQRQHDELLQTGQSKHNELVTTAQARHDELVGTAQRQHDDLLAEASSLKEQMLTEARERSTGMVAEAQQKKAQILEELEGQRSIIERKIEELRGFERTYRAQLRSYFEDKLAELANSAHVAPDKPVVAEQHD